MSGYQWRSVICQLLHWVIKVCCVLACQKARSTRMVWESFPAGKVILVSHESLPWMDLELTHNVGDRHSRSKFILCFSQAVAWLPLASDRERWEWKPSSLLRPFYHLGFICFTLWEGFVVKLSPACLLFFSCSSCFPLSSRLNCATTPMNFAQLPYPLESVVK